MRITKFRLGLTAAVLLLGGWFALNPPAPSRADGQAWTDRFLTQALGPELMGASGPAAAAALADTVPLDRGGPCDFAYTATIPRLLETATLSLHRPHTGECTADSPFSKLSVRLRPSAGVTPANFVAQLTARLGPPGAEHQDGELGAPGHTFYRWEPWPGENVSLYAHDHLGWHDTFTFDVSHQAAAPAAMPSAAEADRWMDGLVAAIGGPLLDADASAIPGLFPGLTPSAARHGPPCIESWSSQRSRAQPDLAPWVIDADLSLDRVTDGRCEQARFRDLVLNIWSAGPVQADAFLRRLSARFGPPALRSAFGGAPFDPERIDYEWRPDASTTVGLTERRQRRQFQLSVDRKRSTAPQ